MSDGSSGAVEFMLSMENKEYLECPHKLRVWLVVLVSHVLVHHVEEVLHVSKVLIWLVDWQTDSVSVAGRCDGWSAT